MALSKIKVLTQEQFDALTTYDPTYEYQIITESGSYVKSVTITNNVMSVVDALGNVTTYNVPSFNTTQMDAINSGINSTKVATYDGYASTITSKLDASKCTFQTTEPTSAITDNGVHIVYLTSEPTQKYAGYIYLVAEA